MPWNEGKKTFLAGVAVEAKRRVKIKAGTATTPPEVEHAGLDEAYIGVTEFAADLNAPVTVRLKNDGGTFEIECTVTAAIACGTALYGGADGTLSDFSNTGAYTQQGVSMEVGVAGQHIEVLPV